MRVRTAKLLILKLLTKVSIKICTVQYDFTADNDKRKIISRNYVHAAYQHTLLPPSSSYQACTNKFHLIIQYFHYGLTMDIIR